MQGYTKDDINLILSNDIQKVYFSGQEDISGSDLGNKALEGAGVGSIVGGTVGGIAAAIAAIGTSLVIPAFGFVVAGSLAVAFAGVGAGAAAGALIGSLVGWGIPDEKAEMLQEEIKKGGVVISVKARTTLERDQLENQWSCGGNNNFAGNYSSGTPQIN